ncbi:receptor [Marivirga sp. S37H4]|uniref:Receptor n=1 Tax=Marivirga aurantiaca TaxID=2802615 RepID=A0A934WXY8_9BACT|nr:7TM diverse intracellular signaling domain-containing protein [Marivirga aurantiaca]MBK6265054.1 receptor [Marivirga aurantiaca]
MLFSLFFYSLFFFQQPVLEIPREQAETILSINELYYFKDTTNQLTFEEISKESFQNKFHLSPNFKPDDYNRKSAYWVKLNFTLPPENGNYVLEFYDQTIDSIDAHISKDGQNFEMIKLGDAYPFSDKNLKHKNFDILLDGGTEYTSYFRIKNSQYADIRIAIKKIDRFIHYSLSEYFIYGLFYGMILIISLHNILIFLAIQEKKYLYYTMYILSVGLYAMCIDGIAYQYLWPDQPEWNQKAYGVALFSIIFWSVIFSETFLNTKKRSPKLHKIIHAVLILRIILFLIAIFFDNSLFRLRNIEIIPLSLIFIAGIVVWIRGYKPARFFVLAYGFLFLGFLLKALVMQSIIPFNILTYYSLHLCFILEMLFLTFALSDRVRILKSNRDRALKRIVSQHEQNAIIIKRINKELERKVEERTEDLKVKNQLLEDTNLKISQQSQEIAEINSMLDLDNWRLKNNLKKVQKERLLKKNLSYEEFLEIFKSKEWCLNILAAFKWKNGYLCQKCNNEKYIEDASSSARRCTKCGYNESPTSSTIFKGTKFPLPKAFYIVYSHLNEDNYTLDEMALILQMRRNTVWQFKQKIEQEISKNGKANLNALLYFGYERSINYIEFQ